MIRYEHNSLGIVPLNELQLGISDGAVERDESGKLIVFLKTAVPFRSLQEFNERLGLDQFEMTSNDSDLSTNSQRPTVFVYRNTILLPEGEVILNLVTWQRVPLPTNVTCDVEVKALGVYRDRRFLGKFETLTRYRESNMNVRLFGSFDVYLA